MERVHEVLRDADPQVVEEISQMLFGDAAEEIVKSLFNSDPNKPKHTPAQKAALAGNSIAIAGGLHALTATKNEFNQKAGEKGIKFNTPKPVSSVAGKVGGTFKPLVSGTKRGIKAVPGMKKVAATAAAHPRGALIAGTGAALGLHGVELHADFAGRKAMKKEYAKSAEFEIRTEIAKTDDDKRLVFGWASIVTKDGKPVVDLQGDYIDAETIEKAAYDYVTKSRQGGYEHHRDGDNPKHVSDMVESIVITDEKKRALGLPDDFPEGWWTGYKVHDDDVWQQVKDGKITGFSVHGSGTKKDYEVPA